MPRPTANVTRRDVRRPANRKGARPLSLPHSKNIACFELTNGIRVYAYENPASPTAVVGGYLIAGALDEPRDPAPVKAGLAGFVADCLTRGTHRYTYQQIYEKIESVGANLSVYGGMFTTGFFAKSLAEDLPLIFELLSEVIRHPTFPEPEVEKERAEWLTGLHERTNSTRAMCGLAFNELCYPEGHPYHYSTEGYPETARAISLDDVRRFHASFYAPADMVIVVVGAVKAEQAYDWAVAHFGDWFAARPARDVNLAAPKIIGQHRRHVNMPGKSQTSLVLGFPGPSQLDPHWLTYAMMNSIFGQFGMYGRLGERVRKHQGLVYSIGSRFEGGLGPGPWNVYAGTTPTTVDRVVAIVLTEMRRMRERKVKPAELDDNKAYFVGTLPLQMQTNEGIAAQILNMVRYSRGLDWLLEYPDRVQAITAADIQAAAQQWLDPDNFVLATAGPASGDGKQD
ncbi:MAG: insulinase family protein [Anaerolineae bacterium]|nr:insulinase family protein [Anaerolineae bacterium]